MPLPDMPKRLIPFPLVLVAVTGAFILIALYADVRGRERRAAETPAAPVVQEADELAPSEPDAATSTEAQPEERAPEALGLPAETPTSEVPAAAVYDCWRYEWRGDRLIVDHDYRHIAGDGIEPAVSSGTVHLQCKAPQNALRSDDGSVTLYWSGSTERATDEQGRPTSVETDTVYRVNALTGELTSLARLDGLDELTDYALIAFTPDAAGVWLRADSSKNRVTTLYRISLTGDVRSYAYPQIWSPLFLTPDQSRAVGIEYTSRGDLEEGGPMYFHRVNLATGARVRTKPITSVFDRMIPEINWRPVFIDDERLVMPGAPDAGGVAQGATVVNVYTGATARAPQLTGTVELLALTEDGATLYAFSDKMLLTAIPVSELPKP